MDKYDKALHDMAIPFIDSHDDPDVLLDIALRYTEGMLENQKEITPALHWSLCTSLAEYLHYAEDYPLYKIKAGYITKDNEMHTHIWLELPDGVILDPIAGMYDDNDCTHMYLGIKPECYE